MILSEMQKKYINKIKEFMKNAQSSDYPFNEMFDGKWRVALPLSENLGFMDIVKKILRELDTSEFADAAWTLYELQDQDWYFDKTGIARRIERQINPKTGETVERKVEMKIGKLLTRYAAAHPSDNTRNTVNFWNKHSESVLAGISYYIIISQHPIDVLRMSDFRNLQSCHSQGGDYFYCAVEEAQGHGPIAYLVSGKDYNKIKDRLQDEEIFADPGFTHDFGGFRGSAVRTIPGRKEVQGILPIARLRIREMHVKGLGSLPVPEKRVYGNPISGFAKKVREWCKTFPAYEDFKAGVRDKKISVPDMKILGGKYADNREYTLTFAHTNHAPAATTYDAEGIQERLWQIKPQSRLIDLGLHTQGDYFNIVFAPQGTTSSRTLDNRIPWHKIEELRKAARTLIAKIIDMKLPHYQILFSHEGYITPSMKLITLYTSKGKDVKNANDVPWNKIEILADKLSRRKEEVDKKFKEKEEEIFNAVEALILIMRKRY